MLDIILPLYAAASVVALVALLIWLANRRRVTRRVTTGNARTGLKPRSRDADVIRNYRYRINERSS